MEKTELERWLERNSDSRRFEDLFFILLESIDSNKKDSMINYKRTRDSLVYGLDRYRDGSNSYYGYQYNNENKSSIISCFDLLLELAGKKLLDNNRHIYLLEKHDGAEILDKHNISLKNKSYLNTKLSFFLSEQQSKYRSLLEPTQNWFNDFILRTRELARNTNTELVYNQRKYSIITFCAAIELGFEPSKKEILDTFDSVWKNLTYNKRMELSFFCEYFAKTNVFQNSLAPAKNIETLLKIFFKGYLENCDDNQQAVRDVLYLHEDKMHVLFNHPSFLHENIQKQILRKNAQKFLGKTILNDEEKEFVLEEANKDKPKPKKLKI